MKKIYSFLIFVFFVCAVIFSLPSESSQVLQLTKKQRIKDLIASNVFVPKNYFNKAVLFLDQIKNKHSYYPSYGIRITNQNINTTSEDWRFFDENFEHIGEVRFRIQISEKAYIFFKRSDIESNSFILNNSSSIIGLNNCLDECFSKNNNESLLNCDCSSWF
jgi:hypothetical protein